MAHEHGDPIDSIICAEVMFDKKNNISGENPRHMEFVRNVAKPLFESWGYTVHILRTNIDYLDVFNHVIEKPRKDMSHKGKKYGFPPSKLCSVKRDCKMKPIQEFYKSIDDEVIQYVGIAIDEPARLESLHKQPNRISLLEKYGLTEQDARELCKQYGLLSPSYALTERNGCWMCSNCKLAESVAIKHAMPDVWEQFMELENDVENIAHYPWNIYKNESIHDRDEMINLHDSQMTIFDFI